MSSQSKNPREGRGLALFGSNVHTVAVTGSLGNVALENVTQRETDNLERKSSAEQIKEERLNKNYTVFFLQRVYL